jgi:hypothetical protein
MASGFLVKDQKSNLLGAGSRTVGSTKEYEFAFPLTNEDLGDTAWEEGRAYIIAFLIGQGETFSQITPQTWMSDQVLIRIGSESKRSIYLAQER